MPKTQQLYDNEGRPLQEYMIECPACKMPHSLKTHKGGGWNFNEDVNKPTFTPSLLVKYTKPITDEQREIIMRGEKIEPNPREVCHSFITDGNIRFLGDCTHSLVGQTVELPEIED